MFSSSSGNPGRAFRSVAALAARVATASRWNGRGARWPISTPPARVKAMCSENQGGSTASATRAMWRTRSGSSPSALPSDRPMPWRSTGTAVRSSLRSRSPAGPATSSGICSTAPSSARWRTTSHRQAERKLTPAPKQGSSATAPSAATAATTAAAGATGARRGRAAAVRRPGGRQGGQQRREVGKDREPVDAGGEAELAVPGPPPLLDHLHQAAVGFLEPGEVLPSGRSLERCPQHVEASEAEAEQQENEEADRPVAGDPDQNLHQAEPEDRHQGDVPEERIHLALRLGGSEPLAFEVGLHLRRAVLHNPQRLLFGLLGCDARSG